MGQAKIKQRAAFAPQLVDGWEADDCVDFAVGLARLTGWLLHVDWWSTSTTHRDDMPLDHLRPLRVYVGDNRDRIFDVRGIKSLVEFNEGVLMKLVKKFNSGSGSVYTRFYDESSLSSLPLRIRPDETKIAHALDAIQANQHFLAAIPARSSPRLPAHKAAQFTYGLCAAFAEALSELTGLEPVAMLAIRFSSLFQNTRRSASGYFHSVVLHPDGSAEDSWGRSSLTEIASRFGVIEFQICTDQHRAVVDTLRRSSGERFDTALRSATAEIERVYPTVPASG